MNWRWLLYDNTDPLWELTNRERGAVMRQVEKKLKAHRVYRGPQRLMTVTGFVAFILIVYGILVLVVSVFTSGLISVESLIGLFVFLGTLAIGHLLMAAAWRFVSIGVTRQAACERGCPICMSCGYWLKGLDDATDRCPECGTERKRLPPPNDNSNGSN